VLKEHVFILNKSYLNEILFGTGNIFKFDDEYKRTVIVLLMKGAKHKEKISKRTAK
jgi:hypothetical protein